MDAQHSGLAVKRPWQKHNTRKLDAIREEIDRLNLDADDKAVALTSLILSTRSSGQYIRPFRILSARLVPAIVQANAP